jgi:hypothetical protein
MKRFVYLVNPFFSVSLQFPVRRCQLNYLISLCF